MDLKKQIYVIFFTNISKGLGILKEKNLFVERNPIKKTNFFSKDFKI